MLSQSRAIELIGMNDPAVAYETVPPELRDKSFQGEGYVPFNRLLHVLLYKVI